MRINKQDYNNVTVIELNGELDSDSAELFRDTIINIADNVSVKNIAAVVLDMNNIGFIDSEGLENLLWARDYCNENCCAIRLAGLSENCEKILEVTRLSNQFDRYAELSEAVKSCI